MAPNLTSLRRGQWSRRQKWCHSQSQSGKLAPHANKGTWLDAVSLFIQYTNYILKRLVFLLEMTELTPNSQACWLFTVESDLLLKLCMSLSFKIGKLLLFFLNIHYDFLYKNIEELRCEHSVSIEIKRSCGKRLDDLSSISWKSMSDEVHCKAHCMFVKILLFKLHVLLTPEFLLLLVNL